MSATADQAGEARLRAQLRAIVERMRLLLPGDAIEPLDSLGIVLLCTEIDRELGCELSPVALDRASLATLDGLTRAVRRARTENGLG